MTRDRDNAETQTASIDEFLDWDAAFVSGLPFCATILDIPSRSDLNSANDRCLAAGDLVRTPRQERARPDYAAWIAEVDRLVEKAARVDLSRGYSFVAAWREGMSPTEAIREAIDWLLAR